MRDSDRFRDTGTRILDDVAKLFTGAAGMAQGVRREAEGVIRSQMERFVRDMDVVTREEFDAVREMAIRARDENDRLAASVTALQARLDALELRLAPQQPPSPSI